MDLWQDFLVNDDRIIHKWVHYFPIYERHFSPWRNRSLTFLEIGVYKGGSMRMWQRYFGPLAKIVGIDIDKSCSKYEDAGTFVRIGDQSDVKFLQAVIDEFGIPDVVLDDGSHRMDHVYKTFEFLYPKMGKNGVYMVEDMHTSYWKEFGGSLNDPNTFINRSKRYIDSLNADHSRGAVKSDYVTRQTFGISFYDSIVCFDKGDVFRKQDVKTGSLPLVKRATSRVKKLIKR